MLRRARLLAAVAGGALVSGGLVAAGRIYGSRTRDRLVGVEAIESREVSTAFAGIASMPQMWLLRRIAITRGLALAGGNAEGRAVDLGCGAGHLTVELAQRAPGLNVTGIDLSTTLLDEAHRRALEAGLGSRVDFRTADAGATPVEDNSVDLVVSTLSLHHWQEPQRVLDEIARILRPGGSFLVFDLRRDMSPAFYLLVWLATRYIVPPPLREIGEPLGSRNAAYTPAEAAALAQSSRLHGWAVTARPFWLAIEGTTLP
jgi:SAM-dependent methyltransferase